MKYEKAVYFVTEEKKVKHIGFFTESSDFHLLESQEFLSQHRFRKDPAFLRKTDDSVYVFSSFLPQDVIDFWFDQILHERTELQKIERGEEKAQSPVKIEKRAVPKMHSKRNLPVLRPPTSPSRKKVRIVTIPKRKRHLLSKTKVRKRRKTLDTLREEVKAQRRWDEFVPTCSECALWEKRYLKFTNIETGECRATGNFVSPEKKACSEFERQ